MDELFPARTHFGDMAGRALERICKMRWIGVELLVVDVVLLVLLLWSFLYLEPESPTYYIAIVSFILIVATLLGGGALVYKCNQLQREKLGRGD